MAVLIKIRFCAPPTAVEGDYVQLHSNGGSGAIDWDTPVDAKKYPLCPGGAGSFGGGLGPCGLEPAGRCWSYLTVGCGLAPAGLAPAGLGAVVIEALAIADACGDWLFGFKGYDVLGNPHTGTPEEITVAVHVTPPAPLGLKLVSYTPATDVLVLAVDDPADDYLIDLPPSRVFGEGGAYGGLDFDLAGIDGIGGMGGVGSIDLPGCTT
jgi:hypothetical protein